MSSYSYFDGETYCRKMLVNYQDTDTKKQMFVHTLMGEFAEAASDENAAAGQTHATFLQTGRVFMITRMSLKVIKRLPVCSEVLVLSTWVSEINERFFEKICAVKNDKGELLVIMKGSWALLDAKNRVILPTSSYDGVDPLIYPNKIDGAPECKKIVENDNMKYIGTRPVYYTDLDCNRHINNSVYNKIATDFLPDEYRDKELAEYHINFDKETRGNEILDMNGCETDNGYIVVGKSGGIRHFASEFIFKN